MRMLIVDDSRLAATSLAKVVEQVDPQGSCELVLTATEMLEACGREHFDVVFLDIEMPGTNGLVLAQRLKAEAPETNVVFVTGFPEYALDAWKTQASAFLVKPASAEDVARALESLRVPVTHALEEGLYVQCFGNFEVFCNGLPVAFERTLTKELLAYLVDRRGSLVSMSELVSVLWEGLPDTVSRRSQLRTLISDLRRTFERLGQPHTIVRRRGGIAVSLRSTECDYYGLIGGLPDAINRYHGEYMLQYSWAETTAAQLAADSWSGGWRSDPLP